MLSSIPSKHVSTTCPEFLARVQVWCVLGDDLERWNNGLRIDIGNHQPEKLRLSHLSLQLCVYSKTQSKIGGGMSQGLRNPEPVAQNMDVLA